MGKATTLTRKGQVTIPKEVRDRLGLQPSDKVEFYDTDDGGVGIRKSRKLTLRDVAGSLPPLGMPIDDAIRLAKDERAARLVRKMREEM